MKIQIDTKQKKIIIEETVKLKELFEFMQNLFPTEWEKYSLESKTIVNWTNPIAYPSPNICPEPNPYPYNHPVMYSKDNNGLQNSNGVINVEVTDFRDGPMESQQEYFGINK